MYIQGYLLRNDSDCVRLDTSWAVNVYFWWHHLFFSPVPFQRFMNSNDLDCVFNLTTTMIPLMIRNKHMWQAQLETAS